MEYTLKATNKDFYKELKQIPQFITKLTIIGIWKYEEKSYYTSEINNIKIDSCNKMKRFYDTDDEGHLFVIISMESIKLDICKLKKFPKLHTLIVKNCYLVNKNNIDLNTIKNLYFEKTSIVSSCCCFSNLEKFVYDKSIWHDDYFEKKDYEIFGNKLKELELNFFWCEEPVHELKSITKLTINTGIMSKNFLNYFPNFREVILQYYDHLNIKQKIYTKQRIFPLNGNKNYYNIRKLCKNKHYYYYKTYY